MAQIIQEKQWVSNSKQTVTINRNNLAAGIYLLEIKTDGETVHKQVVIQ